MAAVAVIVWQTAEYEPAPDTTGIAIWSAMSASP